MFSDRDQVPLVERGKLQIKYCEQLHSYTADVGYSRLQQISPTTTYYCFRLQTAPSPGELISINHNRFTDTNMKEYKLTVLVTRVRLCRISGTTNFTASQHRLPSYAECCTSLVQHSAQLGSLLLQLWSRCSSVCQSVFHALVFCQNDSRCDHAKMTRARIMRCSLEDNLMTLVSLW